MARRVERASAPARRRVGLPIASDGSPRRPRIVRLPDRPDEPPRGRCNNGCTPCVAEPLEPSDALSSAEHVVIRHREPTLRPDLPARIAELRRRGPASLTLLTNGRALLYEARTRTLARAGLDRVIVKLFGLDAATHDAHTRAPGSFAQALEGIAVARRVGLAVHVTFPDPCGDDDARRAFARALTGADPVVLPEPEVEAHPSEFRYDVVTLRASAPIEGSALWARSYFPMVHVHTGPACNLRCTYCNVHGGDDPRLYRREDVERVIDAAAEHVLARHSGPGVPTVDFIGGEPTLHPDLPSMIRHARARGFENVLVCTNGVRLLSSDYLERLVDAGLTGVRFSFHDHRAPVAARLGGVGDNLGARYPEVAELLLSTAALRTYVYRILLAENLEALDAYVRWLGERADAVELTLGMPSMRGRLFENRHLYPKLEGLRERVAAAIALARRYGMDPVVHHAPACLVPDEPRRAACLHIETRQLSVLDGTFEPADFEGDARYGDACARCSARERGCHGVPAAYWEADPAATEAWLRPLA